jgi:hypothetical protein
MAHIDVKCTIWGRYHIPDGADIQKITGHLKNGDTIEDAIEKEFPDSWENGLDYELLDESEERMSLKENNYHATVEVYQDHSTQLWNNEPVTTVEL